MKKITLLFAFILSSTVFSQKTFSPGYYISQSGQKVLGFIEDKNPYNNPEKIVFKPSLESDAVELLLSNISEYQIEGDFKYVKYFVQYDIDQVINKDPINRLTKDPKLQEKDMLLRVLVEGTATLYQAVINDCVFYYIKTKEDLVPQLLIFRQYKFDYKIVENNEFRKQLYEKLRNDSTQIKEFYTVKYQQEELVELFKDINKKDSSLVLQNVSEERSKNKFYYKILTGTSSLEMSYRYMVSGDMKPKGSAIFNPILGVEVSNVLGLTTKRSEIFGRFFYQKLTVASEQVTEYANYKRTLRLEADLSTLNASLGYRYAFLKKVKSKLVLDSSVGISTVVGGTNELIDRYVYSGSNPPNPTSQRQNFDVMKRPDLIVTLGVGYIFKEKYSFHFELSAPKDYLSKYRSFLGQINCFNLLFSYNLN